MLRQFWNPLSATAEAMSLVAVREVIDVMDEMLAPHLFPPLVRADFRCEMTPRRSCVDRNKGVNTINDHL